MSALCSSPFKNMKMSLVETMFSSCYVSISKQLPYHRKENTWNCWIASRGKEQRIAVKEQLDKPALTFQIKKNIANTIIFNKM